MKIILDCDDVLYATNEFAIKVLSNITGKQYSIQDIHSWGLLNSDIDERLVFFHDPGFVEKIPIYDGVKVFVKILAMVSDLYLVTGVDPKCMCARYKRICQDFPEVNPDRIVFARDKTLIKADWALDDNASYIRNAINVKYPILMDRPWNRKEPLPSVDSLAEFVNIVTNTQRQDTLYKGVIGHGKL